MAAGHGAPVPPPPTLPFRPYPEMILEAIDGIDDEHGSDEKAISAYIKRKHGPSLPFAHDSVLQAQLISMKRSGKLAYASSSYFRPDAVPCPAPVTASDSMPALAPIEPGDVGVVPAPAPVVTVIDADADAVAVKRSRGRPRKAPVITDANAIPAKRGRGRPRKSKDPVDTAVKDPVTAADSVPAPAPVKPADVGVVPAPPAPVDADAVDVKRPRMAPVVTAADADTVKRPRGRPRKAPVITDANGMPAKRGRGRPRKTPVIINVDDPVITAADADAVPGMQQRLRPRKSKEPLLQGPNGVPTAVSVGSSDADVMPVAAPAHAVHAVPVPVFVKRGRGRPRKSKDPVVTAADADAVPAMRRRLRPRKTKDPILEDPNGVPTAASVGSNDVNVMPIAAPSLAAHAVAVPAKRGRGWPRKSKETVLEDPNGAPTTASVIFSDAIANVVPATDSSVAVDSKRRRGRPPKPKDPLSEASKKAKGALEALIGSAAATLGVAADANAVPVKRRSGRSPKLLALSIIVEEDMQGQWKLKHFSLH